MFPEKPWGWTGAAESECPLRIHLLPASPPISQVLRVSYKMPPAASNARPTNPPNPADRSVLFLVPTAWGQAPSLNQSLLPRNSTVIGQDGIIYPPLGPIRRGRGNSPTSVDWQWERCFPRGYSILSAVTRKRVNEHQTGRHHIYNNQNSYPLSQSIWWVLPIHQD